MAKKSKMYVINNSPKKNPNKMKIDTKKLQMNLSGGLNRNDGIVKTGCGAWENKKRKQLNKIHKKEISNYGGYQKII